ncbi:hypothetical protein [Kitasatospora sp. NPDC059803]|uniref:hypothetical protein n=1 Tax=Kitasatospora sp. NPDC059803 TaxID=3346953 RepID=UPI003649CBD0
MATDGLPGGVTMLFRATEEEVVQVWERRWPTEFARIRGSWSAGGVPNDRERRPDRCR